MCSFVSVNNRPSSSPPTSSSKSTSTDSTHNSSPNPSEDDDAESCRATIYDEMIDFNKVPFRELEVSKAFLHRNSCGSISGGSLSALMSIAYDDDDQPPLKIRSQSLDS
jgi:hypothetical protein